MQICSDLSDSWIFVFLRLLFRSRIVDNGAVVNENDEEMKDEEPMDEEPMDEEPMDEEQMDEEQMDEEPMDEELMDEEPTDEETDANVSIMRAYFGDFLNYFELNTDEIQSEMRPCMLPAVKKPHSSVV